MKAVDPIPVKPSEADVNKAANSDDRQSIQNDQVENVCKTANASQNPNEMRKMAANEDDDVQHSEDEPRDTSTRGTDLPKEEVFGSLVSLNEFNPNSKHDH